MRSCFWVEKGTSQIHRQGSANKESGQARPHSGDTRYSTTCIWHRPVKMAFDECATRRRVGPILAAGSQGPITPGQKDVGETHRVPYASRCDFCPATHGSRQTLERTVHCCMVTTKPPTVMGKISPIVPWPKSLLDLLLAVLGQLTASVSPHRLRHCWSWAPKVLSYRHVPAW